MVNVELAVQGGAPNATARSRAAGNLLRRRMTKYRTRLSRVVCLLSFGCQFSSAALRVPSDPDTNWNVINEVTV